MSASNKSSGCKKCKPCQNQANNKQIRGGGIGNGSGKITCPGGAGSSSGIGSQVVKNINGSCRKPFTGDCAKDLAKQIDEKLCGALPGPGFFSNEICYDCNNITAMVNGTCSCGKFKGDIQIDPGSIANRCNEVPCGV